MATTEHAAAGPIGIARPSDAGSHRLGGRRRLRTWGAVGVVLAAIAALLARGLGSSLQYFRTASQAVADRAQLGTSQFRLEGSVVRGTIRPFPGGVRFSVRQGGATVPVDSVGSPPELFTAGMPVVLVGHFSSSGPTFLSTLIMVKHSASYVAAHPNRVKGDPRP